MWRADRSILATPALAIGVLIAIVAGAETAARSTFVRSHLAAPSLGSPSRVLEVQLAKLEGIARGAERPRCILIGSSLILFGIDPDAFDGAFHEHTGDRLAPYNLGVPGISASALAAVARIVAEDYRPKILIYGMAVGDFTARRRAPPIETTPWVRYRSGQPNLDGWLTENSRAFRYVLLYQGSHAHESAFANAALSSPRGFYPVPLGMPLLQVGLDRAVQLVSEAFRRETSVEQIAALAKLLGVRDLGAQLVILEMPAHLDVAEWPQDALASYREKLGKVREVVRAAGVPFWSTPAGLMPDDGWIDLWHANARGAAVLGRWLGERLAEAVRTGEIAPLEGAS
jgi:hypothetical protein